MQNPFDVKFIFIFREYRKWILLTSVNLVWKFGIYVNKQFTSHVWTFILISVLKHLIEAQHLLSRMNNYKHGNLDRMFFWIDFSCCDEVCLQMIDNQNNFISKDLILNLIMTLVKLSTILIFQSNCLEDCSEDT